MVIFNKYRSNLFLNKNNFIYYKENVSNTLKKTINYVFIHRNKFLRGFIYFYSFFLVSNCFSAFNYKNNPDFVIKIDTSSLLLMAEDFNNFM